MFVKKSSRLDRQKTMFGLVLAIPLMLLVVCGQIYKHLETAKPFVSVEQCLSSWKPSAEPGAAVKYFMPVGYRENPIKYFHDLLTDDVLWQPMVYNYAAHFADKAHGSWIIDVGGGTGLKAARIYDTASNSQRFVELDFGRNLIESRGSFSKTKRFASSNGAGSHFAEWNISGNAFPDIGSEKISKATIVSSDVIEHLPNPDLLVDGLLRLYHGCNADTLIISTHNRKTHGGPPPNPHHIREWSLSELKTYLESRGANVRECILTHSNNKHMANGNMGHKATSTCLISKKFKKFPEWSSVHNFFPYSSK